jgi:hypothetical protein
MNKQWSSKDLFKIKFYRWAHSDFQREVENGYPLIRQVLSLHMEHFLQLAESLSISDQRMLASGLTKRFHEVAVEKCQDGIQPRERELVQVLLESDFHLRDRQKKWHRGEMRSLLAPVLDHVYGVKNCEWGMGECDFQVQVGNWRVRTFLDTQSFGTKFSYFHTLHYLGEEMEPMTSVLNWLGICGGGSSWDAAETPAQVIPGFTAASKKLLEALRALDPDSNEETAGG